jgi:hypothetical protein
MTTLSLLWIELIYRVFTTQAIFNGDVFHIVLINTAISFVFVFLLSLLPSIYHRALTLFVLVMFMLAAPVYTTLTLSHVQYGPLAFLQEPGLFDLYEQRYEAFIRPEFWLYGLGLLWLLIPFKIRRRPLTSIKLGLISIAVVV